MALPDGAMLRVCVPTEPAVFVTTVAVFCVPACELVWLAPPSILVSSAPKPLAASGMKVNAVSHVSSGVKDIVPLPAELYQKFPPGGGDPFSELRYCQF